MIIVRVNALSGLFVLDLKEAGNVRSGHQLPLYRQDRCSACGIDLIKTDASHAARGLAAPQTLLLDSVAMVRPSTCREEEVRTRYISTIELLIPAAASVNVYA